MVYFVLREAKRSKGIGSGLAFLVPRKFWPILGLHIRKRQAHIKSQKMQGNTGLKSRLCGHPRQHTLRH